MAITHVKHVDTFHIIYKQYKRIGKQCAKLKGKRTILFASACRVLELMREEQIKMLIASGIAEDDITDDKLGFVMTWDLFSQRADGHYSARSYEDIIQMVLDAGAASRLYVECHRCKDEDGQVELIPVCGEDGRPITYRTFDEAWAKRRSRGEVVNYYFFNATEVNNLTKAIYGQPTPTPPQPTPDGDRPGGKKRTQKGGAQRDPQSGDVHAEQPPTSDNAAREGNLRTESSSENIAHGSQNCEPISTQQAQRYQASATPSQNCESSKRDPVTIGRQQHRQDIPGSQNCEGNPGNPAREGSQNCGGKARKTASNKNLIKGKQESLEEIIISAPRAIDPLLFSQFDFSQQITSDVILQLARLLYVPLPACYKSELDKEAAYAKEASTAQALAEWPIVRTMGLRRLAATMAYHADEASPCRYRAFCRAGDSKTGRRANPGLPMRLHQLASETILRKMSDEMDAARWWPDYLPRGTGLVETPPEVDLAELAGIDAYERIGMDRETCQAVEDALTGLLVPYGYGVEHRRVGATRARGYAIVVRYTHEDGTPRSLRFYRPDEWDLIVEADGIAPIGSLEFVRHLRDAVQRGQVA